MATTKKAAIIGLALLTALLGVAYLFLPTSIEADWPREPFASQAWKASPPNTRFRMTRDLMASGALIGKPSSEVEEILGRPEYKSPDGHYWSYSIQDRETGVGGFDAVTLLDVDFGEGKSVVTLSLRRKS